MLNPRFTRKPPGFAMSFPLFRRGILELNNDVPMTPLALNEFHRGAGASFTEVNGSQAVSDYGDWMAEYTAVREGAAVVDMSFRGRLCLLGADRQRFLNGQVTNNVKDLRSGLGCYAALVSAKGKLQSDLNIYCLENEMLLDLEPGFAAAVSQRLEKFVIAEDVQIIDASAHYGLLSVQGPKSVEVIGECPKSAMAITKIEDPTLGEIYVVNHAGWRGAGFDLFVPIDAMREMAGQLVSRGGRLCGWRAFETVRVERGVPRFGADMDETNLAPEALGEHAISYSKGCYIGQEVIARIRTYGHVAKSLRCLKLDGDAADVPVKGAKIFLEKRKPVILPVPFDHRRSRRGAPEGMFDAGQTQPAQRCSWKPRAEKFRRKLWSRRTSVDRRFSADDYAPQSCVVARRIQIERQPNDRDLPRSQPIPLPQMVSDGGSIAPRQQQFGLSHARRRTRAKDYDTDTGRRSKAGRRCGRWNGRIFGFAHRFGSVKLDFADVRWCNGSTRPFGGLCHGSNPCRTANPKCDWQPIPASPNRFFKKPCLSIHALTARYYIKL